MEKDFDLYLIRDTIYKMNDSKNILEEFKYFKIDEFYLSNNGTSNENSYKFTKKDILKIEEKDIFDSLLEYNEINNQLLKFFNYYNLKTNEELFEKFSNNFKKYLLFDDYKGEDNYKTISIITYKNDKIIYDFDSRIKRDFNDYIYFENIETFKTIIKDYLYTKNNINENIIKDILNNLNYNQVNDFSNTKHLFKTNNYFTTKEEYEKNIESQKDIISMQQLTFNF